MRLLARPVLGAVPDAEDLHLFRGDAIHDDVGPQCDQLAGARDQAGPSAFGQVLQPVACGDDLHGDPVCGGRVVLPDVGPYPQQVRKGRSSESYGQGGGGSSASVPQDSNQRRTAS